MTKASWSGRIDAHRPSGRTRAGRASREEGLEHARLDAWRDAGAVVSDSELDAITAELRFQRNDDVGRRFEGVVDEIRQGSGQCGAIAVELDEHIAAVDDQVRVRRLDRHRRIVDGLEQVGDANSFAGAFAAREYEHVLHQQVEMTQPLDALLEKSAAVMLIAPRAALGQIQQRAGQRRANLMRETGGHLADRAQTLVAGRQLLQRARLRDVGQQDDSNALLRQRACRKRDPSAVTRQPIAVCRARATQNFFDDRLPGCADELATQDFRGDSVVLLYASTVVDDDDAARQRREQQAQSLRRALRFCRRVLARAARVLELARQARNALLQRLIRAL